MLYACRALQASFHWVAVALRLVIGDSSFSQEGTGCGIAACLHFTRQNLTLHKTLHVQQVRATCAPHVQQVRACTARLRRTQASYPPACPRTTPHYPSHSFTIPPPSLRPHFLPAFYFPPPICAPSRSPQHRDTRSEPLPSNTHVLAPARAQARSRSHRATVIDKPSQLLPSHKLRQLAQQHGRTLHPTSHRSSCWRWYGGQKAGGP